MCASTGRNRLGPIHNQVRAWRLTFGMSGLRAPLAEIDGNEVVVLETRLTEPGGEATRVECGDGPLWVVATEPGLSSGERRQRPFQEKCM